MEEQNKNIDQDYKNRVEKEKQEAKEGDKFIPPAADFSFFITTLSLQASIFLGLMENPVSKQKEEDLNQAKFIIDTLDVLKEKTRGNLSLEEENLLENMLYELKMAYILKGEGKK